ncbi:MAG: hypothetical protein ACI8W7_003921 [Gammaproteobacteria bacterium]
MITIADALRKCANIGKAQAPFPASMEYHYKILAATFRDIRKAMPD